MKPLHGAFLLPIFQKFLIDEAHNLVSRAREMYSAALIKEDVLAAKRLIKDRNRKLTRAMDRVNKLLLEMKRECDGYGLLESVAPLAQVLAGMQGELEEFLEENPVFEDRESLLEFYFQVRDFLMVYELTDERYRCTRSCGRTGRLWCACFA